MPKEGQSNLAIAALGGAHLPLHGDAAAKLAGQFEELAKAQDKASQARLAVLQAKIAPPNGGNAGNGQALSRGNDSNNCWDWEKGSCKRGHSCHFMQDMGNWGRPGEAGACHQFKRSGVCKQERKFPFAHEKSRKSKGRRKKRKAGDVYVMSICLVGLRAGCVPSTCRCSHHLRVHNCHGGGSSLGK